MPVDSQTSAPVENIIFRNAVPSDIDAVMRIETESFAAGLQEEKELYMKRINIFSEGFLVAEDTKTGEVGAYISSELWHEDQGIDAEILALGHDPGIVHTPHGTQLYITSFGTLSSWRGRKIGTALFDALESHILKNFPAVSKRVLIVSEKWMAARHIYSKKGFKETGRIIDFFLPEKMPPEDAVIMMK